MASAHVTYVILQHACVRCIEYLHLFFAFTYGRRFPLAPSVSRRMLHKAHIHVHRGHDDGILRGVPIDRSIDAMARSLKQARERGNVFENEETSFSERKAREKGESSEFCSHIVRCCSIITIAFLVSRRKKEKSE